MLAVGLIFYGVDRKLFLDSVRAANVNYLLIALVLFFPIQYFSAYRWYFILARLGRVIPFRKILYHSVLGQLSSLVLPGSVSGDLVRLFSVSQTEAERLPLVLSIIIDKVALLLAVATFVLAGAFASGPLSQCPTIHLAALCTVIAVIPVLFMLCVMRGRAGENVLVRLTKGTPLGKRFVLKAVAGSSSLPPISARGVFAVILSAVLLVGAYTAGSYFVALAMHIEINPVDWIAINAIASFVQIFPITAGGLGVREGTFAIILGLYGVSFDRAVAFSLTGFTLGAMLTSLLWVALASVGAEPSSR